MSSCEALTWEHSLAQQAPAVSWAVRSPSRLSIAGAKPACNPTPPTGPRSSVPSSRCVHCSMFSIASYNAFAEAAAAAEPLVARWPATHQTHYGSADCTCSANFLRTHVEMYHVGLQCLCVLCPLVCIQVCMQCLPIGWFLQGASLAEQTKVSCKPKPEAHSGHQKHPFDDMS